MNEIKAYGKSELALLYFPNASTAHTALNNLNSWIKGNRQLSEELKACGMPQKSKFFTPREVSLIFTYLGEP
jgi:hypothetical protein